MLFLFHHGDLVWKLGLAALTLASASAIGRRWGWAWAWCSLLPVTGAGYAGLWALGQLVLPTSAPLDHVPTRLLAAAAFPGARDDALDRLASGPTTNDDDGLAVRAAQDALAGRCPSASYLRAARPWIARELARLCGHDVRVYDVALGAFDAPRPSLVQALASGRYAVASSLLTDQSPCTSLLFSYWGGDARSLAALDSERSDFCHVLAHVAHEQALDRGAVSGEMMRVARMLGVGDRTADWFDTDGPQAWTVEPGDVAPDAFRVRALAMGSAIGSRDSRLGIEAYVRAGQALQGIDASFAPSGIAEIAAGTLPDELHVYPRACPARPAFEAALAGDGGPLAAILRTCRVSFVASDLIDVLSPHIVEHRAELARSLRLLRDEDVLPGASPFVLVDRYARYRDLSRLAGDVEEADRWQQLVERFVAVLSDRRRAQALAIVTR